MNSPTDVVLSWREKQNSYFDAALAYCELQMPEYAEAELDKIDHRAAQSVPVLALRLIISYNRKEWSQMKTFAQTLLQLEPSNPKWPYSDGYATARIESITDQ